MGSSSLPLCDPLAVVPPSHLHENDQVLALLQNTDRDNTFSATAEVGRPLPVERLGAKIEELLKFIKGKKNVHGDIRHLADSISAAYHMALEDLTRKSKKTQESTSQTSPSIETSYELQCSHKEDNRRNNVVKDSRKETLSPTSPASFTEVNGGGWQQVSRKKKKKQVSCDNGASSGEDAPANNLLKPNKKRRKARTQAILIKPSSGRTYADILKDIKGKVKPEEIGIDVKSIRQTKEGGVLLEINKMSGGNSAFAEAIRTAVGDKGTIKQLTPMTTIEILDLDEVSTEAEIREALKRDYKEKIEIRRINLTKVTARGQRAAFCEIDETCAIEALEKARIKVGWVKCRIRPVVRVMRCFKCLGFGHRFRSCKGPDRTGYCYKCGGENHKARDCTKQSRCFLCHAQGNDNENLNHISGSGACKVYRAAVAEVTKAQK
uniref:Putative myosin-2 heavy chain-like protein panstrongylus lignarius n=1 Tax=Xenopsylla cheopis TaxID=163159 RepID=A0A6M2DQ35_XENCH